jgi:pilus assembly protein CpaF
MGMDSTGRYRGRVKSTGLRPHFMEKLRNYGIDIPAEVFEREI